MSRTVVIHQPDLLPHLGFFHRFLHADLFVALDHVQFVNGTVHSWTHRDKIKTPRGAQWLSVSVKKAPRDTPINAIELSDTDWREQNLNLVRENYRTAPFFSEVFDEVERLYARRDARLVDFTLASIEMLQRLLVTPIARVESATLDPVGRRNELLVDLLGKVGATHYLSGTGARAYYDPAPFLGAGIEVVWQTFTPPVYPQLHGEFIPNLSSVDVLFNCGVAGTREILRSC